MLDEEYEVENAGLLGRKLPELLDGGGLERALPEDTFLFEEGGGDNVVLRVFISNRGFKLRNIVLLDYILVNIR